MSISALISSLPPEILAMNATEFIETCSQDREFDHNFNKEI